MTTTELATAVRETLMSKPNKGQLFKAFANVMGVDYPDFVKWCNKTVEATKAKLILELEAEIERIKKM